MRYCLVMRALTLLEVEPIWGSPKPYHFAAADPIRFWCSLMVFGVSDPSRIDSSFDINLIPLEQIERLEILKGAASTIYGNTAAAGVINIITKRDIGF